ncbi:hypothetical protein QBC38DRAFT_372163 [Podospora fimiseda]|uniref:Cyclin n=1 Tax=Podospora fimiseda TaxID=252190 RepID=A0AAN7BII8_9PEZI|nr:hypothetical protein QBC38DRAFT_372163 [Podospora fimiseda]
MGTTTFEMPHLAASKAHPHMHHHPSYTAALPPTDRYRPALNERPPPNEQVFNPLSQSALQASTTTRQPRPQPSSTTSSNSYPSSATTTAVQPPSRQPTSFGDQRLAFHSMEIPDCISPRGGNLAHFMAEVTSFFWFESIQTIDIAEKVRSLPPRTPIPRLTPNAVAPVAFKNWTAQVVSTTQIARNVVLLGLLYIYRLKHRMSTARALVGSEYRLLTVAMMLGNKFLDDNTYTNKTWADVTTLGVADIHMMEVEFLSNVRYNLLVSADEWQEWLLKLSNIREYMTLAQRTPSPTPSPLLIPSPAHRSFERSFAASPLPSPLDTHPAYSQQQILSRPSPTLGPFPGANGVNGWPSPSPAPRNAVSPLSLQPQHQLSRKRSISEDEATEPPAKRPHRIVSEQQQQQQQANNALSRMANVVSASTMPTVPNLTLNTAQASVIGTTQPYAQSVYAPAQASPLSLPPLVSGVRAMSTVYPTTTGYAPQQSVPATCGPSMISTPQTVTPTTSFPPISYGTPTRRLSPQHSLASNATYAASSPLADAYGQHAGTPGIRTPISHSPSIYLQHRNSPYRPVRGVNTLLIPPPAALLQQYHFPNALTPSHLHYQPLGRRNEYRTGIVPEYTMPHPVDQHNLASQQQVLPNPNHNRAHHQMPYQPQY